MAIVNISVDKKIIDTKESLRKEFKQTLVEYSAIQEKLNKKDFEHLSKCINSLRASVSELKQEFGEKHTRLFRAIIGGMVGLFFTGVANFINLN